MPSEKTQRPALMFALENLNKVKWLAAEGGLALANESTASLFDDCRSGDASHAHRSVASLRRGTTPIARQWPPMQALGPLIAESYSLAQNKGSWERNAFSFGNVSPLITRTQRFVDDPLFTSVIDTSGSDPLDNLDWRSEASALVNQVFGGRETEWRVHIVDLRLVMHDLMPFVLGALLELFAYELFSRGQVNKIRDSGSVGWST